ncbi:hypothetical protein LOY34_14630 [Pseudomonas sp. B21-009]|uniref:hypothetical protein n=1 Tax=Pseudomonas sp. B21-009 TaxID=2895470 RepID=UPI00215F8C66|nr:hypothetical protein [Pseudomonas sp. B21-009]UVM64586.1 hypothetical protein LOY34_14630 [Pseudomonas sp. B21-009]
MSDLEHEDISQSLAAELTGTAGMTDHVDDGQTLPNEVADQVEAFEQHQADKASDLGLDQDLPEDATPGTEVGKPTRKLVPLGALQEERAKRQELQAQLVEHQQQLARLQQQQVQWQQWQLQQQQLASQQIPGAGEQIPDFDEDPRGYIEAKERQFAQVIGGMQQQQQAAVYQAELQRELATAGPAVAESEARFMSEHPDYRQAFDLVQANADAQLRAQYPSASPDQLGLVRQGALLEFARICQQRGLDPAAEVYAKAQALGHIAGTRTAQVRKTPPTSLSNLSGAGLAPDERGRLTASAISDLSDAEFDQLFDQMEKGSRTGLKF